MPTTVAPALRALLERLIDYAGTFPPATLTRDEAIAGYRSYRAGEHSWMLARLVVSAADLPHVPRSSTVRSRSSAIPMSRVPRPSRRNGSSRRRARPTARFRRGARYGSERQVFRQDPHRRRHARGHPSGRGCRRLHSRLRRAADRVQGHRGPAPPDSLDATTDLRPRRPAR